MPLVGTWVMAGGHPQFVQIHLINYIVYSYCITISCSFNLSFT
jgi:hypothetical protein